MLASLLLCLFFPALAIWAHRQPGFPRWLSSIVACYLAGIIVANLRLWEINPDFTRQIAGISMMIGLPLLLFAVRIRESFRYARKMLISFGLCCLAGILCTSIVGWYLTGSVDNSWKIAGMLTGLYTGGTPNVNSIGIALEAPSNYLVLVQSADIILGGAYLLGLISFLPSIFSRFFPYQGPDEEVEADPEITTNEPPWWHAWPLILLGVLVTASSLGFVYWFTGALEDATLIILLLTSVSLVLASIPSVQQLGNSYPVGEYCILIFCVAIGLEADFRAMVDEGIDLLYFSALALGATTLLHLILCYVLRIDRDTVILSSVAAFYGPVFVVQVAAAIENRRLLAAGLAVSLLGFGLGNYLGLGVAYTVKWLAG